MNRIFKLFLIYSIFSFSWLGLSQGNEVGPGANGRSERERLQVKLVESWTALTNHSIKQTEKVAPEHAYAAAFLKDLENYKNLLRSVSSSQQDSLADEESVAQCVKKIGYQFRLPEDAILHLLFDSLKATVWGCGASVVAFVVTYPALYRVLSPASIQSVFGFQIPLFFPFLGAALSTGVSYKETKYYAYFFNASLVSLIKESLIDLRKLEQNFKRCPAGSSTL